MPKLTPIPACAVDAFCDLPVPEVEMALFVETFDNATDVSVSRAEQVDVWLAGRKAEMQGWGWKPPETSTPWPV